MVCVRREYIHRIYVWTISNHYSDEVILTLGFWNSLMVAGSIETCAGHNSEAALGP